MKIRESSLFDTTTIAPVGSKVWAEENRKALQDAFDTATDGKVRLTDAVRHFWTHGGWKLLEDAQGQPFKSMRAFALAPRPEGLHLSLVPFKAFIKTIGKTVEEMAEHAEAVPEVQGRHKTQSSLHCNDEASQGNTADYLTRRIAREHKEVLADMKAGKYKSVHAAAKAAGIIHSPTPLESLSALWRKIAPDERMSFLREMLTPEEKEALIREMVELETR